MKKTLSDMARYIKSIIPVNIPETYNLKPMFKSISDEESICNGVLVFRDFLYLLCDRLINDGSLYDDSPKNTKKDVSHTSLSASYPFLDYVRSILLNIGYHGELTENNDSIFIDDWQVLTTVLGPGGYWQSKAKIAVPKLIKVLRFLTYCGINFNDIDLDQENPDMSKVTSLRITYPENSIMLIGFKAMALASKELHINKINDDIFLRCDYRVLKDEEIEAISLLKDTIHLLPSEVQDFVLKLHQHYIDVGLTCKAAWGKLEFVVTYSHKSKEIWSFSLSFSSGYRILIKANNTNKYPDVIEKFPLYLQEKISKGYGCEKKRFGEPCQHGCHGFSFSLDESMLEISKDIEIWLDRELLCLQKK